MPDSDAARRRLAPTEPTVAYLLIQLLFRFVLRIFYSSVVVEGAHLIPATGGMILVSNHVNSLTDALLLVTTLPRSKRRMLRLTAKATQFNRGTFTSWLIESAGTLPIQRPKDHLGLKVDNSAVFATLIASLEKGDCCAMFPEGLSRYYPELAPLKQGVARIVSSVLKNQKDTPGFELAVQTCSITYLHRNLFRSDVLVTFHPPLVLSPTRNVDLLEGDANSSTSYDAVRKLTTEIGDKIRSGTLDAPSWNHIRVGNTARRLYAPLGTKLSLGDHVRLTQKFVAAFSGKKAVKEWDPEEPGLALRTPMVASAERDGLSSTVELEKLMADLKVYQDLLQRHAIKDDRVRDKRMGRRRTLYKRLLVRAIGAGFLGALAMPGMILWAPIFLIAKVQADRVKRTGPEFDTWDEVAQTKLVYGLLTGIAVYTLSVLVTFPIFFISIWAIPCFMWLTLRWTEDGVSSLRAAIALFRLLQLGKPDLQRLRVMREDLRGRVTDVAVQDCGLPRDAERWFREKGRWRVHAGFFSLRRRRKKDWNEVLRLSDQTEYPQDDPRANLALHVPTSAIS